MPVPKGLPRLVLVGTCPNHREPASSWLVNVRAVGAASMLGVFTQLARGCVLAMWGAWGISACPSARKSAQTPSWLYHFVSQRAHSLLRPNVLQHEWQ